MNSNDAAGRRRLARLALPIAIGLALAACAPGGTSDDDGGGSAGGGGDEATGATSLRVTVWTGNEDHLALFDQIAAEFVEQHETVEEVDFDVLPFEDYNDSLTVQLAGGNAPDLGWIFERNAPEFVEAGALHDVGGQLRASEDYGFDDIEESAMALWSDGDAVYGYPFSTSPFAMFYNAEMFDEAGLETPSELLEQGAWTWEAAADAAATVVDEGVARHGMIVRDFDFDIWDNLATVWRGWGASAWSEDGTECEMADPEMVDAMTYLHDLIFERGGHPGPGQSADFFAQDAAMTITQISRANLIEDAFDWGIVPLPEGPAGAAQVVGQAGVGVFSASQARAEAVDFLEFWTNEENSQRMAQFFPPPRGQLLTADLLAETNPLLSEDQLEEVVIQGIATGDPIPSHRNFAQVRDTVRSELDALWEADADVSAVLEQVCASMDPLLDS